MAVLSAPPIRGGVTYTAASGTTPSAISLGTTIDPAKCEVSMTVRDGQSTGGSRDLRHFWGYVLTSTTIAFVRNSASFANGVTIEWEVTPFANASVQRGATAVTAAPTDITISAVDLARTLLSVPGATTSLIAQVPHAGAALTSTTNLRFTPETAPSAGQFTPYWQVTEFADGEIVAQRGAYSRSSGEDTWTVTISSVDTDKAIVHGLGFDAGFGWIRDVNCWAFNSGTQIRADRFVTGTQESARQHWQVIEVPGGAAQSGQVSFGSGSTTPTAQPSLSPAVDLDAASVADFFYLPQAYAGADETDTGPMRPTIKLDTGGAGVTMERGVSGIALTAAWAVLVWDAGAASHDLDADDLVTGAPTLGSPAVGQVHGLAATGVTAGTPALGVPALGQTHNLAADSISSGAPTLGEPALSQSVAFTAVGIASGVPTLGSPALGQVHALAADGVSTEPPSIGEPALAQVHTLAADPLSTGTPTLGSPSLSGDIALSAVGITAGVPTLGSPSLTQVHVLAANDLETAAPTLGMPSMSGEIAFTAETLSTGAPVLGAPALAQTHAIAADNLVSGAPVIGAPSLAQRHAFAALAIVAGNPTLGSPAAAQTHVLVANDIEAGAPVLGTPTLNAPVGPDPVTPQGRRAAAAGGIRTAAATGGLRRAAA